MSKIVTSIILSITFTFYLAIPIIFYPKTIYAQNISIKCSGRFQNYVRSASLPDKVALGQPFDIGVSFNPIADTSFNYSIKVTQPGTGIGGINIGNFDIRSNSLKITDPTNPNIKFTMSDNNNSNLGIFRANLMHSEGLGEEDVCELGTINFYDKELNDSSCNIKMPDKIAMNSNFTYYLDKTDKPKVQYEVYFYPKNSLDINKLPVGVSSIKTQSTGDSPILVFAPNGRAYNSGTLKQNNPGQTQVEIPYNMNANRLIGGDYVAVAEARKDISTLGNGYWLVSYCSYHFFQVQNVEPTSTATDGTSINKPGTAGIIGGGTLTSEVCIEKAKKDKEIKCAEGGGKTILGCSNNTSNPGIATALGCIHTNPAEFVKDLMTWVIGIGGGLAFLMMLLGAFQMLTSAGNPETLNAGKDRLTSAVIGLLLVIFAILLLQIIGVGILKIPGFG